MADVRIRLTGRKDIDRTSHNAAFTRYLALTDQYALEVTPGGFVIETWGLIDGVQHPLSVVFFWEKTVDESQAQTVLNLFGTIAAAEPFDRSHFQVTFPKPPPA